MRQFFNFSKLFKLLFPIKKSHIYNLYRNVHYRNSDYGNAKVQIIYYSCKISAVFVGCSINGLKLDSAEVRKRTTSQAN